MFFTPGYMVIVYNYHIYNEGFFFPNTEICLEIVLQGEDESMIEDSGLDAVISAFIRYPEMSSIKYEAKHNTAAMEMILKGHIGDKQQRRFVERSRQSLALFYRLHKIQPSKLEIDFAKRRDIYILSLTRDLYSLTEEEIEVFIVLACQEFSAVLLTDVMEQQYNGRFYHDFKKSVMQKINRERHPYQKVFAYRDGGKMFVFDK